MNDVKNYYLNERKTKGTKVTIKLAKTHGGRRRI